MSKIEENKLLDLTNEEYHADNGYFSSSQLKEALKSKVNFHNKYITKIVKKKESRAFDEGTTAHILFLEPHLYDQEIAVYNGIKNGKKFDLFKKENKGKIILSKIQESKIKNWVSILRNHGLAQKYSSGGIAEQSIFTEINGTKCKARFDYCNPEEGYISDLKTTTGELTEDNIRKKVYHWGYHISAAYYIDCFNKYFSSNPIKDFYLIFISKDTLQVQVVKIHEDLLEEGRQQYLKAIEEIKLVKSPDFICKEEVLILRPQEIEETLGVW